MNLASFLAHAAKLEYEAERTYLKLTEMIDSLEHKDAVAFFHEMAGYAAQHCQEVMTLAGIADISELPQSGYSWPTGAPPESVSPLPVIGETIDLDRAMEMALTAERGAVQFYEQAASSSSDPEVKTLAEAFAVEERGHVLALERFMGCKPY